MPQHSVIRPHGLVIATDPETGRETTYDTKQCCHCDMHWVVVKGSGRVRGFCTNCMQDTCGAAACHECVPWKKKMDLIEAGKAILL